MSSLTLAAKKFLILAVCVAGAFAVPDVSHLTNSARSDREAEILKQDLDVGPDGKYVWAIETNNGISAHEHGEQKKIDAETSSNVVGGAAGWTSPEGEKVELHYTADENGYQATGSHIPIPPPIPEYILRSIEYIRTHPAQPERS